MSDIVKREKGKGKREKKKVKRIRTLFLGQLKVNGE
jgi:hypothetical protein